MEEDKEQKIQIIKILVTDLKVEEVSLYKNNRKGRRKIDLDKDRRLDQAMKLISFITMNDNI